MCELLGMNCNVPTDITFSFAGFRQRGGRTGPHQDGWGIAFYEGKGARLFHDVVPSVSSEIARLVEQYPIKSTNVISHIRRRTRSRVCIENTHPFQRELWGRTWVFAHNGYLTGIKRKPLTFYRPIGTTDSEHAFCYILDVVRSRFREPPPALQLRRLIGRLADEIAADHPGGLILVGVLDAAVMLVADLVRRLPATLPVIVDFLGISRFAPDSGRVRLVRDLDVVIEDQPVVLVETIIDTGLTVEHLVRLLQLRRPARIAVCGLLDRTRRRILPVELRYRGIEVDDDFLVGYGLGFRGRYANLDRIVATDARLLQSDPDTHLEELYGSRRTGTRAPGDAKGPEGPGARVTDREAGVVP
jgi:hypoxanthine phosphoribosyltransferase